MAGNPSIQKYSIKPVGDVAMSGHLQLRIDGGDLDKLRSLPNWRDLVREKIKELIA